MPTIFKALTVQEIDGKYISNIENKAITDITQNQVLIQVQYSSLNYKDALSCIGNKGVTKRYPHTPGIDAAGIVVQSKYANWKAGDKVIVTGFDLGMNTDGGFAEYITVPGDWLIALPETLTFKDAMTFGTAGLTAALSVHALLEQNTSPEKGSIAVSGATGGVGSFAVAILSKLDFDVTAISTKSHTDEWLRQLGAKHILQTQDFVETTGKPLLKPVFAGAIDTVGGNMLTTMIRSLQYGATATACGMAADSSLQTTVFPFILKANKLIGIDSVECPLELRKEIWEKLASEWRPAHVDLMAKEITLEEIPGKIKAMLAGQSEGRYIIRIGHE